MPKQPQFCKDLPPPICKQSSISTILHIKFDLDWPTALRDILVSKYNHMRNFFLTQGHITLKRVVSNSFKTLCLTWLPSSLKKTFGLPQQQEF